MFMSWLWTATAWDGASHTEHLEDESIITIVHMYGIALSQHRIIHKTKQHAVPADVRLYLPLSHRHHGYWCSCGQPVGFVVAAGIVADLIGGAVEEGDGAEPGEA